MRHDFVHPVEVVAHSGVHTWKLICTCHAEGDNAVEDGLVLQVHKERSATCKKAMIISPGNQEIDTHTLTVSTAGILAVRPGADLRANDVLLDGLVHRPTALQRDDVQVDLLQRGGDLLHLEVVVAPADDARLVCVQRLKGVLRQTDGLDLGAEGERRGQLHQRNVELLLALVLRVHKDGGHLVHLQLGDVNGADADAVVGRVKGAECERVDRGVVRSLQKEFKPFLTCAYCGQR